jgi:tetratricopeptide (TPR) repeat protein
MGRLLRILFFAVLIMAQAVFVPGASCAKEAAADEAKALSLHYYRGIVFFESGKYEAALNEFQAVSGMDPYYKETPKYVKKTLEMLDGYRSQVLGLDKESLKKEGFDLYFLGKSYYEKGDYRRAKEAFQVVLAKNPNDKFAHYYSGLCDTALGVRREGKAKALHPSEKAATEVMMLEKEVKHVKDDIRDQESDEGFVAARAERRAQREDLIRAKEKQLEQQEELLQEEKDDYLARAKLLKRAQKIQQETEKWKGKKESLGSREPGIKTDLTEFPLMYNKAQAYYKTMKESLLASRWNSAGLNAIQVALMYCDALLIYNAGVKSAYPLHENLSRLLRAHIKRADTEEALARVRAILNVKELIEGEERPMSRKEALFLSDHAEKIIEWCQAMLP